MIDVFLILVSTFVVFGISFSLQLLQKKYNNKRGISLNCDESLSIDLILFLFISIALMIPIVYISLLEFETEAGKLLNDSGLLLACLLLVIGKATRFLFSKIRCRLRFSQECPNTTISFLLSSAIYIVILARLGAIKSALTFIALIIGKFIWFDTTKDSFINALRKLIMEVKTYPLATAFMFISILVGVVVGNDIFLGIVFWGNLISLIAFLFYMRSTKKGSNDISN